MRKYTDFIKKNASSICIIFLVLISVFLHFYLLPSHLHFAGDEAHQSQIIKDIVTFHQFPYTGPTASIGKDIYHGAFFYYFFLLPGIVSSFNPLGFAYFTAILSVVSVYLLYYALKNIYGPVFALITTCIYTISENMNIYGRWEWNPNTIPFFTILSLFALVKFFQGKKYYLTLFAFSLAAITQLHLTGYIFIPIGICLLPFLIQYCKDWKVWLASIIAYIIPWLPTIHYELKTHFLMFHELIHYFLHPMSHISPLLHLQNGYENMLFLYYEVVKLDQRVLLVLGLIGVGMLCVYILRNEKKEIRYISIYIFLIVFFSYIMYAFYPGIVFIHYGEQLFPIFPILTAGLLFLCTKIKIGWIVPILFLSFFCYVNWQGFTVDIINGKHEFQTENEICNMIKAHGNTAHIIENGVDNPVDVGYVCNNEYGIALNEGNPTYIITTNNMNQFTLSTQK